MLAAESEWKGLDEMGTFEDVDRTEATSWPIPLMWVFTYKYDSDGYLLKFKARIVVRGDLERFQEERDVYAATLAAKTFRALIAIAAFFDLDIYQFDITNAFTHAKLEDRVFVRYPEGMNKPGKCIRLVRALYGLRISPKLWYNDLSSTLEELGLKRVPESPCLYMNQDFIVFFYVDDIMVLCWPNAKENFNLFRTKLCTKYKVRELQNTEWFLGIRIVRSRDQRKIWLCQDSYIDKITEKFKCHNGSRPSTPLESTVLAPYEGKASQLDIQEYGQRVGSINYAATMTRPDVSFAAQKLAEFLLNPSPSHIAAANRVVAYLQGTCTKGPEYGPTIQNHFEAASDASYADDVATRRSTEGYVFFLFGGPVDWRCTKQKTVTTSTTEAELLALSHTAKVLYSWRLLFTQIELNLQHEMKIFCDNQQTVRLLLKNTPRLITKLRHVDIHNMWLRQEVERKKIHVEWIRTEDMKADGFTKPLPRLKHDAFVRQLNLQVVSF